MMWLDQYFTKHQDVIAFLNQEKKAAHLNVMQESLLYLGAIVNKKGPLFIVKENEHQANELAQTLQDLDASLRILKYSHEESLRVEAIAESDILRLERVNAIYKILQNDYDICITHAVASIRKISRRDVLKHATLSIKIGQNLEMETLERLLIKRGYTRVKYVERPFTFAMRGGICDVFSPQDDAPIRIEFFDVEIDSLRYFDISTQRSLKSVDEASILFGNDIILEEDEIADLKSQLYRDLEHENDVLQNEIKTQLDLLENFQYEASMYPLLATWKTYETIYDYLEEATLVFSPIEAIERSLIANYEETVEFIQERYTNDLLLNHFNVYSDKNPIQNYSGIHTYEFQNESELHLSWHPANIVSNNIEDTLKWLKKEAVDHRVILVLNEEKIETMIDLFLKQRIPYEIFSNQEKNGIYISQGNYKSGFTLEDIKTTVFTQRELYRHEARRYRFDNKFMQAEVLHDFQDLELLDYVVHRQYGIGRYHGITTKEINGILKDFMRIEYRDGDELFVPLEQFSLVRKYISSEAIAIKLSKLGSSAWKKNQERLKENVNNVAERLIELYKERMKAKGHAFSKDTPLQLQFEQEFMHALTRDQEVAIEEIKHDMESEQPMDRLLCGDVGFGKTEVSIRAAFKAVVDSKQVVFLCPTTILSAQHYRTFKARFENYPVTIEVLNRFVSPQKQKDIIKRFKEGKVDVLIGTHRVLSKDVKPHDLGLLIIDEEQRFGVEHKERIKEIRVNVDVLSLSATPIPRTLQMSLVGLRSLSQLNTPPSNRLPVMTYVIEKNEQTLFDIIRKELNRDGQAFYLYNDVQRIYGVATSIQMYVDQANVGVVHGQMDRYEIEDVMFRFIQKEINVLVCTTIIETGIDIPNANTIIVDNAHRFGLSQLYQIKGRVGRSDRLAYAYFVVPQKKNLTEIAQKRLQAIKEFTQLGSGYKIAMRDLTIRGAGEILGGNQSGFIDTVGIDLYVELLKDAIDQRKGIKQETETKQPMNLQIEGFLPNAFTQDDGEKLEIYQDINRIETLQELKQFYASIEDRYGKLPNTVMMLLEKKRLEIFLSDGRIKSFKEMNQRIEVVFTEEYSHNVDGIDLFELVSKRSYDIKVKYLKQTIILTIPKYETWVEDLIYILEHVKEK